MIQRLAFIVVILLSVQNASGQTATPEEVARAAGLAYKEMDFEKAAELMHPDALASFQEMILDIAELDTSQTVLKMFMQESDAEAIGRLSPSEVFARFIGTIFRSQKEATEALRNLETEIIGHVSEGDSVVHVVTRSTTTTMGIRAVQMEVVSLRQHEGEWRTLLKGELSGLVEGIRHSLIDKSTF